MTAAELQQRFKKQYVTADWLDTLRQILPQTEIFAKPQAVPAENARVESVLQLGKILLAGDRNLALLEVIVDESTDLPGNRAALRHLVARYIDQAEYHGVFATFHQKTAKDYRFTFAAREAALDDAGQLIRTETAPRRYTYLLGPNESCRTAAERFDLLARKGEDATLADIRAAFDKEPLTREFFKRFEVAIEAVKTDLEKHQSLPSAQAYSRAQLLLERLLFLYFVQNRGWLNQKRNYLLDTTPRASSFISSAAKASANISCRASKPPRLVSRLQAVRRLRNPIPSRLKPELRTTGIAACAPCSKSSLSTASTPMNSRNSRPCSRPPKAARFSTSSAT
jgi:hypothetical protein